MIANLPSTKFPSTRHLAWLARSAPRGDKVMSPAEAKEFLDAEVVVEEKVDGANLGIRFEPTGEARLWNRGTLLDRGAHPQFGPLWGWLGLHGEALRAELGTTRALFGEWCVAVHSMRYDRLPDWFLAFDVLDLERGAFWSAERRDALVERAGLASVPRVAVGRFTLDELIGRVQSTRSELGPEVVEGVYVRREQGGELCDRAKLVRAEFVQAIEEHWRSRKMERNRLAPPAGGSAT